MGPVMWRHAIAWRCVKYDPFMAKPLAVLVVDDDEAIRNLVVRVLRAAA
jgi:hypothetical protein